MEPIEIEGFAHATGVYVNRQGAWLGDWNPDTQSVDLYADENMDYVPAPSGWETMIVSA